MWGYRRETIEDIDNTLVIVTKKNMNIFHSPVSYSYLSNEVHIQSFLIILKYSKQ